MSCILHNVITTRCKTEKTRLTCSLGRNNTFVKWLSNLQPLSTDTVWGSFICWHDYSYFLSLSTLGCTTFTDTEQQAFVCLTDLTRLNHSLGHLAVGMTFYGKVFLDKTSLDWIHIVSTLFFFFSFGFVCLALVSCTTSLWTWCCLCGVVQIPRTHTHVIASCVCASIAAFSSCQW